MQLGVLGPLSVRADEREVVIAGNRQRTLLATLLLHGGTVVSVDALTEAVWDGRPPKGVRGALHTSMTRLRLQLGPAAGARIVAQSPGYCFRVAPEELDVHRFEAAALRGRRALAQRAWAEAFRHLSEAEALWRGAPLEDVCSNTLRDAWSEPLRHRLLAVGLDRIDAGLQLGRHAELLTPLHRLAREEPLDERVHERLMLALYRDGRTSEALAAFQRARRILVQELGVEPGPALRALHDRILAADPALAAPPESAERPPVPPAAPPGVPAQLPSGLADFTGRMAELRRLEALLTGRTEGVPIAVLSGCGGLGKSALAVQVAHRVREHFPDGQLYARLGGHGGQPRPVGEVLASFLLALGVEAERIPGSAEDRADLFRTVVADRRILIVLDDARDTAELRLLLPGTAWCAVVITSRVRLAGLCSAVLFDLDVLPPQDSLALLAKVAGPTRIEAEPRAAQQVVEACAGLPLAVRIVGARLAGRPNWRLADLADLLTDENHRMRELQIGDLAVAASFALSYAALREADNAQGTALARAFRLLGLAPGPTIGLAAATALLDQPPAAAEEALEALVDSHLLESAGPGRYRFHSLLRAYARNAAHQEEPEPARAAAAQRLLELRA